MCKINGLNAFFRESFCTKCNKKHYATFCKRILPHNFYEIICCVILCIFYKYEVRFASNFQIIHQKTHFFKKMCPFWYFLQVWSDYPRARRGFFVLKNSTFLRKCVRFVSFKNILVSCLKHGRLRRFPNVQTPVPSRTGIK